MKTRLTTFCVALFFGLRAFAQTGDIVTANYDGTLYRPTNFFGANASAIGAVLNTSLFVPNSRLISTAGSLTGGGDLTANRTLQLVGDNATPGASTYYGTDGSGTKGFYALPNGAVAEAPNNGTAYWRRNAGWSAADFSLITGLIADGQIPAAIARDAEIAAAYPPNTRTITGTNSITGGGDLSANLTLSLVGDSASPGASRYWGTDGSGTKGFFALPTGSIAEAPSNGVAHVRRNAGWSSNDFALITGTASDAQIPAAVARDAEVAAAYPPNARTITGANSITGGGDLSANRTLSLSGDSASPGASRYYGTDGSGTKGFFTLPTGLAIGTNGGAAGNPIVLQPDGTLAVTNSQTVSNLTVTGNFDTGTNIQAVAKGGTGATNAAGARVNLGVQAADSDLDGVSGLSTTGMMSRIGSGSYATRTLTPGSSAVIVSNGDGVSGNPTVDVVETNLLTTQINGGAPNGAGASVDYSRIKGVPAGFADGVDNTSTFNYDIDLRANTTDGSAVVVLTNGVPANSSAFLDLTILAAGPPTNVGSWKLLATVANYSGSGFGAAEQRYTNYSAPGMDASLSRSGTNILLTLRGPTNGNQNITWLAKGILTSSTNHAAASGGAPAMTNGVVAHYAFEETSNAALGDSIGGNNLTISSGDTAPTTNALTGFGAARAMDDGLDVYFSTADNAALSMNTNSSFTVTAWIRANTVAANRYVAAKGGEWNLQMVATDSTIRFQVANASTNRTLIGPALSSGTTYFIGAGYNFTNGLVYMLVQTASSTNYYSTNYAAGVQDSSADFLVSGHPSNTAQNWLGTLDEISIFKDRAVSTNDLQILHNGGAGRQWPWSGI